jgi:hypothetical protein
MGPFMSKPMGGMFHALSYFSQKTTQINQYPGTFLYNLENLRQITALRSSGNVELAYADAKQVHNLGMQTTDVFSFLLDP